MKRNFNGQRLYKLLVITVVLVTIYCAVGAWNNSRLEDTYSSKWTASFDACWTQYWNSVDAGKPSNIDKWVWRSQHKNDSLYLQQKDWCMAEPNAYFTTYTTASKDAEIELEIAIFLPLLFLGGVFFYKYLFPYEKNK